MPFRFFFIFLFFSYIYLPDAFGQITNECGVVAKMTPEGDSITTSLTNIAFNNASINATDYQFIVPGYFFNKNTPINITIAPGLTEIKLVAYNGSCTDTAVSYYFYSGEFPADSTNSRKAYGIPSRELTLKGITRLSDSSLLMFGHREANFFWNEGQMGILIKAKPNGCIEWSKFINTSSNYSTTISTAIEASDGNIFIVATTLAGPQHLSKLDPLGNTIWSKGLPDESGFNQNIRTIVATSDGGLVSFSDPVYTFGGKITRIDAAGQIVWQNSAEANAEGYLNFYYSLIKDDYVYLGGYIRYNNPTGIDPIITKIALANGQMQWLKKYAQNGTNFNIFDMHSVDSTIIVNINANHNLADRPTIGGVMRINTSGNVKESYIITDRYIANPLIGPFSLGTSMLSRSVDNNYYIMSHGNQALSLQGDGTKSIQIKLNSNFEVQWVRSNGGVGQPRFNYIVPGPNKGYTIGGKGQSGGLSPYTSSNRFLIVDIDSNGTNPNAECDFALQNWDRYPGNISSAPVLWNISMPSNNIISPYPLLLGDAYAELRYNCPNYIDSCSYLKISGPAGVCNISNAYTYKAHRNKSCGQPASWTMNAGTQLINQTDSSITVRFTSLGRHVIYARNLLSCVPLLDSIVVYANTKYPSLELGENLQVCSGNTKTIHAGPYYKQYLWHDGSTDSLFQASQPGKIWVRVIDSCENIFSDTIYVTNTPSAPLSAGSDKEICEGDTVTLTATPGFMNYHWGPNYRINNNIGQTIMVNPLIDTFYTVTAEFSSGCFSYDTILIKVNPAIKFNLGNDTSICNKDSLSLVAPPGFAEYLWNTGDIRPGIFAKLIGKYYVLAKSFKGCVSSDTINIVSVYPLPEPKLDSTSFICEGSFRTLTLSDSYSKYLWSNGATTSSIKVKELGTYSVTVYDLHNCKGYDTTNINSFKLNPNHFLPNDTSICLNEKIFIKPFLPFSSYLWNDGTINSSIVINKSGAYWLNVVDQNGCSGTDTILVKTKTNCLQGVFVPSAFTPNNDGKNDIFRPIIYGTVNNYSFKIYNRWGGLVFQTSDPQAGWDGKIGSIIQGANTYVWSLTYQLNSESIKTEKGTFILLR